MKFKFADLFAFIIASAPFIYWFQVRVELNGRLPIHWGHDGQPDRWESAQNITTFLLILTILSCVVYIILRFLKRLDPKRTAQLNEATAVKVGLGIISVFSAICLMVLMASNFKFDITRGLFVIISVFFAFLGNVMYNIKPNYFIGLRLPWTLEDESNWRRTHRLAGVLWFVSGCVSALLSLLIPSNAMAPILFSVAISLLIVPTAYSFIIFRKAKNVEI